MVIKVTLSELTLDEVEAMGKSAPKVVLVSKFDDCRPEAMLSLVEPAVISRDPAGFTGGDSYILVVVGTAEAGFNVLNSS